MVIMSKTEFLVFPHKTYSAEFPIAISGNSILLFVQVKNFERLS